METEKEQIRICKIAKEQVRRNAERIKLAYGNRYIRVRSTGIVDSDEDEIKLATRVGIMYPDNFVLISNIERILNPTDDFMGPYN